MQNKKLVFHKRDKCDTDVPDEKAILELLKLSKGIKLNGGKHLYTSKT